MSGRSISCPSSSARPLKNRPTGLSEYHQTFQGIARSCTTSCCSAWQLIDNGGGKAGESKSVDALAGSNSRSSSRFPSGRRPAAPPDLSLSSPALSFAFKEGASGGMFPASRLPSHTGQASHTYFKPCPTLKPRRARASRRSPVGFSPSRATPRPATEARG